MTLARYGLCGNARLLRFAARTGFDFGETTVANALVPTVSEDQFRARLRHLKSTALPYTSLNGFLPPSLKVTGPEADVGALERFSALTLRRAEAAGISVIVFGSGRARQVPEGFDREEAIAQLHRFGSVASELAERHGVTIALEPLNREESNILNTIDECAALIRSVAHPSFRLLVDSYHFLKEGDRSGALVSNIDLLCHVHVATLPHRLAPGSEPCPSLVEFLVTLTEGGYHGPIAIEAAVPHPGRELPRALRFLRESVGDRTGKEELSSTPLGTAPSSHSWLDLFERLWRRPHGGDADP